MPVALFQWQPEPEGRLGGARAAATGRLGAGGLGPPGPGPPAAHCRRRQAPGRDSCSSETALAHRDTVTGAGVLLHWQPVL